MRKAYLLILLFSVFCRTAYSKVVINEVMQSNINGIMDDLGEFPDSWVEIYNDSDSTFNFTFYGIGQNKNFSLSFPIFTETKIAPHDYLLIYCDKEEQNYHTDFRLECEEKSNLYLFDPYGHIIDSIAIPEMIAPNISYGRIHDGNDTLSHFLKATPKASNTGFYTETIMKKPYFTVEGGLYSTPVMLHIVLQGETPKDAVIRYTTNGSEPTEKSPIAPDSILIDRTTIIKAKVFSDSALSKVTKTESYIFLGRETNLPVFSVTTDSLLIWSDSLGIYTIYDADSSDVFWNNFYFPKKRPANFEYFINGKSKINQIGEFKIGGNCTQMLDLKSLVLYSGERFEDKRFKNKFWSDRSFKKSKSISLRNAGNDNFYAYLRDPLIHTILGHHCDVDWQAYQPCILLINGEYYGLMNIRERSNDDNIWENYNGLENIDLIAQSFGYLNDIKKGDVEEWEHLDSLFNNSESTFADFENKIDINEFTNFLFTETLFGNMDFPGNNTIFWKEKGSNKKWRWFIKDLDWSLGYINAYDYPYLNYLLRVEPFEDHAKTALNTNPEEASHRYQKLFSYPEFKNQYIDKNIVFTGTFLHSNEFIKVVDSLSANIRNEIEYMQNWDKNPIQGDWETHIQNIKNWYKSRVPYFINYIHEFFSLDDTTALTINCKNPSQLYFNNIKVEGNKFNGYYYKNRPLYLSRCDTAFKYKGDSILINAKDSAKSTNRLWYIRYEKNDSIVFEIHKNNSLYYQIPSYATNVHITDTIIYDTSKCNIPEPVVYVIKDSSCYISEDEIQNINPVVTDDCSIVIKRLLRKYYDDNSIITDNLNNQYKAIRIDSLSQAAIGESEITWRIKTLTDSFTCHRSIQVIDSFAPYIKNCNQLDTIRLAINNGLSSIPLDTLLPYAITATDNCGTLITGELDTTITELDYGNQTIYWHYTDAANNRTVCKQVFNFIDKSIPVYEECGDMDTIITYITSLDKILSKDSIDFTQPVALDNGNTPVYGTLFAPDSFAINQDSINWVFTDDWGNSLTCKQIVVVKDMAAPYYEKCEQMDTLFASITDNRCVLESNEVELQIPTAKDNLEDINGVAQHDSIFSLGENAINWIFTDKEGNTTQCEQTLIVTDHFAPIFEQCEQMDTIFYDCIDNIVHINSNIVELTVPTAKDNCNEIINGIADKDHYYKIGNNSIFWNFTDLSGNKTVCKQTIHINDKREPFYRNCENMDTIKFDLTENACEIEKELVTIPTPTAYDNNGEFIDGQLEGKEYYSLGDNEINWMFADFAGNKITCQQIIRINDKAVPQVDNCNNLSDINKEITDLSNGLSLEQLELEVPVGTDNCNQSIFGELENPQVIYTIGEHQLNWLFTDEANNKTVCKQNLNITDKCAPKTFCDLIDTIRIDLEENANTINATEVTLHPFYALDNGNVLLEGTAEVPEFYNIGDNQVLWRFEDASGNASYCTQTILATKHFVYRIYPNPVKYDLYLAGIEKGINYVLFTNNGQIIKEGVTTGNPTIINMRKLAKGLYLLEIEGLVYKIIKD